MPVRFDHPGFVYLKTLGHPALLGPAGEPVEIQRKKDLALLVFLRVDGAVGHSRGRLAALLWGEHAEKGARHSLTQALGRLVRTLPPGSLAMEGQVVRWEGPLRCDAADLLEGLDPGAVDDAFSLYAGPFLEGFHAGRGAEVFTEWADRRRADLRNAALRVLAQAGEHAVAVEAWTRVLRLGERAVHVDPVWERGRRLVMHALAASGERNRALRYYEDFAEWLEREFGSEPDPETRALADQLRAPEPADPPPRRSVTGTADPDPPPPKVRDDHGGAPARAAPAPADDAQRVEPPWIRRWSRPVMRWAVPLAGLVLAALVASAMRACTSDGPPPEALSTLEGAARDP